MSSPSRQKAADLGSYMNNRSKPVLSYEVTFPTPDRPLSENESRRLHWAARKRRLHPWREQVQWVYKRAVRNGMRKPLPPCEVRVTLGFARGGRRDPANYIGTVVKEIVDGMVELGAWPDDTPEYVRVVEPTLVVSTMSKVELWPMEASR